MGISQAEISYTLMLRSNSSIVVRWYNRRRKARNRLTRSLIIKRVHLTLALIIGLVNVTKRVRCMHVLRLYGLGQRRQVHTVQIDEWHFLYVDPGQGPRVVATGYQT